MPKELTLDEQIEDALNNPVAEQPTPEDADDTGDHDKRETDDEPAEENPEDVVVSEETPAPVVETPKIDPEMAFHLREEKRLRQAAEAELVALRTPKPVEQPKAVAPDPNEDPVGYVAFKQAELEEKQAKIDKYIQQQETTRQRQEFDEAQKNGLVYAVGEFINPTVANPEGVKDWQEVSTHLERVIAVSIKNLHPSATPKQISAAVDKKIIELAESAAQQGHQPAKYLYDLSKNVYGYKPKEEPKLEVKPDPTKKPDLKVVEKNRKKSANGLSGGSGKTGVSIKDLENMSLAEMEEDEEASSLMGFR